MEETTLDGFEEQPKKRPIFLTVICILTWVGSGIAFLSSLVGFFSNPNSDYNELANTPGTEELIGLMPPYEEFVLWSNVSNGVGFLVAIICIVGALLMFQLKKNGFFLYLAGCIISIVISFMAMSHLMPSGLAWAGYLAAALGAIISVAFIIMYAVNLKHMK